MKYFDMTDMKQKVKTINFNIFLSKMVLEAMQSHQMDQFSLEKCCFVRITHCGIFHPDLQLWQ